jgi:glycosyltransferase involved in cell wall biosynthesis
MTGASPVVAVNGRFVTQPLTGVQRYGHEIVSRLAEAAGGSFAVRLIVPPDRVIELAPGETTEQVTVLDERWWGGGGHRWEQTVLPRLVRRAGGDVLLSPAGWGPLLRRRHLVVVHDLHPITHPDQFVRPFVWWTRLATPFLTHVPRRVGATSDHVREQVVRHLRVRPDRIDLVPPAVGPPFVEADAGDLASRRPTTCVFVGGDKAQKNLAFVLRLWPEVHRRTGLELVVTERRVGSRAVAEDADPPGVRRLQDPSDDELVGLYRDALCLLWPSLAEGFGIPLLEAMAVGTPFLATDVGAARELAVEADQVLPLEPRRWIDRIVAWHERDPSELRVRSMEAARSATWERSAGIMAEALRRSLS